MCLPRALVTRAPRDRSVLAWRARAWMFSARMKLLGRWLSRKTSGRLLEQGCTWQDGFHDTRVRSAKQFQFACGYIEENPVRAGLVKTPSDWPWSSANRIRPRCRGSRPPRPTPSGSTRPRPGSTPHRSPASARCRCPTGDSPTSPTSYHY